MTDSREKRDPTRRLDDPRRGSVGERAALLYETYRASMALMPARVEELPSEAQHAWLDVVRAAPGGTGLD